MRAWLLVPSLAVLSCCFAHGPAAQRGPVLAVEEARGHTVRPLDTVAVVGAHTGTLVVSDGTGRVYLRAQAGPRVSFVVGGSLGTHTVRLLSASGSPETETQFEVDAETLFEEDSGRFQALYQMAHDTMTVRRPGDDDGAPAGGHDVRVWRGQSYRLYNVWLLDHAQTSKGMAYVSPHIRDGAALFRDAQRPDGMIWSFFQADDGRRGYWDTAYGPLGYAWHDGGQLFARQPVDNHSDYQFVELLFIAWQASGDDRFMKDSLDAALRALDYGVTSAVRYSSRFGLLKRPYCIDSWDFQADDAYLVRDSLAPTMTIDPARTKFGVFFGDNTGYIHASRLLAIMLAHAGRDADGERVSARADQLASRLRALSWNGQFFRHFVEEDASVKRDFGVDEQTQLAQANAYSLNRSLPHDQAAAIVRSYQALRERLPSGSPGEWYAIYPPFPRGFGPPDKIWQYMNGGVSGHAAGELARGALTHGFEAYGVSVLERSAALAARTDGKIHFTYTGSLPTAPVRQEFTPVDLRQAANMDTVAPSAGHAWMDETAGNDLAALPAGELRVGDTPFQIVDPAQNQRRAVVAVARQRGYPNRVELRLNAARAASVYLLHTVQRNAAGDGRQDVAAGLTFRYTDGSERGAYLKRGQHVAGWWYPELSGAAAGVAWRGPNQKTGDVGLSWCALDNPEPDKPIAAIVLSAAVTGDVYALAGLTLADRKPDQRPSVISYGGPDNWAGATMLAALIQGLGGVLDTDRAYTRAELSPRWSATPVRRARVLARYGASRGYVGYDFEHDSESRSIAIVLTGSGQHVRVRVLLPADTTLESVTLDGARVHAALTRIESARYVELDVTAGVHRLVVHYAPSTDRFRTGDGRAQRL